MTADVRNELGAELYSMIEDAILAGGFDAAVAERFGAIPVSASDEAIGPYAS